MTLPLSAWGLKGNLGEFSWNLNGSLFPEPR